MAVHKIKAKDDKPKDKPKKVVQLSNPKTEKKPKKSVQKAPKHHSKFVRILLFPLKPFFALGRYFRDSWREIRLVQWPTRRFTWKMTLSVIGYVVIFVIFIGVLDLLFTLLFTNIIK